MPPRVWHILTGEYPPDCGGVADYTTVLARALVAEGQETHVWSRGNVTGPVTEPGGVIVHRVAGDFGPPGLSRLGHELERFPRPRIILIQYVPHAYGWKAMNLPFAAWVARLAHRGDDVRVMFHEVAFPWVGRPLRHNLIAAANRLMVALLLRACSRAYVSIPGWIPILRQLGGSRLPIIWTPVPSNVPGKASSQGIGIRRSELTEGDPDALVVGHFSTYASMIGRTLAPILLHLLNRRPDVRILLLGNGGDRWRLELAGGCEELLGRIVAPGTLPATELTDYLQACDLVILPYPDGVSCRRGTVMAALANGVPILTTIGSISEPIWAEGSVAFLPAGDDDRMAELAANLLDSPVRRGELGRAGRRLYEERFTVERTVSILLRPDEPAELRDI